MLTTCLLSKYYLQKETKLHTIVFISHKSYRFGFCTAKLQVTFIVITMTNRQSLKHDVQYIHIGPTLSDINQLITSKGLKKRQGRIAITPGA